jgi:hypothetical protein
MSLVQRVQAKQIKTLIQDYGIDKVQMILDLCRKYQQVIAYTFHNNELHIQNKSGGWTKYDSFMTWGDTDTVLHELKLLDIPQKNPNIRKTTIQEVQLLERQVITKFLTDAINQGYSVTVDNGEDDITLRQSTNIQDILKEMFSVDEEQLYLYKDGVKVGWVILVYGEDGWDVIADYSTNLESLMTETNQLIDHLAGF